MAGSPWESLLNSETGKKAQAAVGAAARSPLNPWAGLLQTADVVRAGAAAIDQAADPKNAPASWGQPQAPSRARPVNLLATPAEREAELFQGNPIVDLEAGQRLHYRAAREMKQALDKIRGLGKNFSIIDSFRTREEQEHLYNKLPPGQAAVPGTSHHESGFAVDTEGYDDPEVVKILEEHGFAQSVGHEPWHFSFQPGISPNSNERKWGDDDPRMKRFRQNDQFTGTIPHMAQSQAAAAGFSSTDQSILLRLWDQESGFDPKAESGAGALGIGQIMPANLPKLLAESGYSMKDYLENPQVQIQMSLKYVDNTLRQYDGNWAQTLAAYNGGGDAVEYAKEHGYFPYRDSPDSWYQQTLPYVAGILQVDNATAMKMISGEIPSPTARVPDHSQNRLETKNGMMQAAQEWASTLFSNDGSEDLARSRELLADVGGITSDMGMAGTKPEKTTQSVTVGGFEVGKVRSTNPDAGSEASFQIQNVAEGFKMLASGFITGMMAPYELNKAMADPERNPLGMVGAVTYVSNPLAWGGLMLDQGEKVGESISGRDLPGLNDWGKALKSLAPAGWWKDRMDENTEARGGESGMEWVNNRMPWGKHFLNGDTFSGKAWSANMSDFFLHIPYLAGMEMNAQLLGPSHGLLSLGGKAATRGADGVETIVYSGLNRGLGAPGELTYNLLKKMAPGLVEKLGKPFFQETAIWGGVGGAQMAAEATAKSLAEGSSAADAIGDGMAAFFPGYLAGTMMGLGFGIPMGLLPVGAKGAASKVANATGKLGLPDAFDNFFGAAINYPGREMMARSFADLVRTADDKVFKGKLSERLLNAFVQTRQDANFLNELSARKRSSEALRTVAQEHLTLADSMDQTWQGRQNDLRTAFQQVQTGTAARDTAIQRAPMLPSAVEHVKSLNQEMEIWNKAKGEHLTISQMDPAAQGPAMQAWLMNYGQTLGVKDAGEFHSAFAKKQADIRKQVKSLPEQFDGVDIGMVQKFRELEAEVAKSQETLKGIEQDPIFKDTDNLQATVSTLRGMAQYLESKAQAVEAGMSPARNHVVGQPLDEAFKDTIRGNNLDPTLVTAMEESINLTIRAGLGSSDPMRNSLAFESTRAIRSLIEAGESGNLAARMDNVELSLSTQIETLKSELQVPITNSRPRPPAKKLKDARKKDYPAEDIKDRNYHEEVKEWEIRAAAWDRDIKPGLEAKRAADKAKLQGLESQLDTLKKARSGYDKFDQPASPKAAEERVVQRLVQEDLAGMDADARQRGFDSLDHARELADPPVIDTEELAKRVSREMRMSQPKKPVYAGPRTKKGHPKTNSPEYKRYKQDLERWREHEKTISDAVASIRDSGEEWVHAKVPTSWLGDDLKGQLPVTTPYKTPTKKPGDPVKEKNRYPATVVQFENGTPFVLSGGIPMSGKDKGFVRIYLPKSAWDENVLSRMPGKVQEYLRGIDVPVEKTLLVDGQVSNFTVHGPDGKPLTQNFRYDPVQEARDRLAMAPPEEREGAILNEFFAVSAEVAAGNIPALQALKQLQALWDETRKGMRQDASGAPSRDEVPSIPGRDVVPDTAIHQEGDFKRVLDADENVRRAWQEEMDHSSTTSLTETWSRTFRSNETYMGRLQNAKDIGHGIGVDYDRQLRDILRQDPRYKHLRDTDPLPKDLRERFVDALEAMGEDPTQMQTLLREMPELRKAYGAFFSVMKQAEKWQLDSPEMQGLFRDYWFRHVYPDLQDLVRRVDADDGKSRLPGTKLATDLPRTVPTMKVARELGRKAQEKVANGNWDGIRVGQGAEERVRKFVDLSPEKKAQVLGLEIGADGTLPQKSVDAMRRTTIHLGLRNPLDDPGQVLGGFVTALMNARATRDWIRDQSLISIPGAGMNPRTGRPYSVVEFFDNPESVPAVPGMARVGDAKPRQGAYVSLGSESTGIHPHAKIRIGGQEFEASKLYIWEDALELRKNWFEQGGKKSQNQIDIEKTSELLRKAALFGKPVVYGSIILGSFWNALNRHALATVKNGLVRGSAKEALMGVKLALRAPGEALGMLSGGNKIGMDPAVYAAAVLDGLNLQNMSQAQKAVYEQMRLFRQQEGLDLNPDQPRGMASELLDYATDQPTSWSVLDRYANPAQRAGPSAPVITGAGTANPEPGFPAGSTAVPQPGAPPPVISGAGTKMPEPGFPGTTAQPTNPVLQFAKNVISDWNAARDAHQHLGPMLDNLKQGDPSSGALTNFLRKAAGNVMDYGSRAVNATLSLDQLGNQYLVFEASKQAMVFAHSYWKAVFMQEWGQKLLAQGLPESVVHRQVGTAAADYVNKMAGSLPAWKDPKLVNDVAYSPFIGPMAPGITRAKFHLAAELLDSQMEDLFQVPNGYPRGEFSTSDPVMRDYRRRIAREAVVTTFSALYGGMALSSFLINQKFPWQHPDPNMRMKQQVGDRAFNIITPLIPGLSNIMNTGMHKDLWKMSDAAQSGDPKRMVRVVTDNFGPIIKLMGDLERNEVPGRDTAFGPEVGWDLSTKSEQGLDVLDLTVRRLAAGLIETAGGTAMYDRDLPGGAPGAALWALEQLGYNVGTPYAGYSVFRARAEQVDKKYASKFAERAEPYLKAYYRDGDEASLDAFFSLAEEGVLITGEGRKILGGTRWYPSDSALESMHLKFEDPREAALAGLPSDKSGGGALGLSGLSGMKGIKGFGGGSNVSEKALAKKAYLEEKFADYEAFRQRKFLENLMTLRWGSQSPTDERTMSPEEDAYERRRREVPPPTLR